MLNAKDVTILVAVLNKKDTIRACLDSLLSLKELPAKIMIVDGYSKDGTYEILKEYGNKIDLRQFPENLSRTFNWALDNIDTEYTALTDGDCVVAPDWLEELLKGFEEKDTVATAGYCGTPEGLSLFQKIIGWELENRFKRLPKYIFRAPTMNLCLKTAVAKKVKFDEKQMVNVEMDFGFRLSKLGKMVYLPRAKVFHYHRSTLKGFFKQQKDYAKWGSRILKRHGRRTADSITNLSMILQIPLLSLGLVFVLLSFLNQLFAFGVLFFFLMLFFIYLKNIAEINPPLRYYPAFLGIFILRTIAWLLGTVEGLIRGKIK